MNYFRMYPGDYLRDTSHLTPLQHGCFLLLLLNYYARGKPLPADKPSLYRIASAFTEEERLAVDFVAEAFFEHREKMLYNRKADELLAHDLEKIESAKRSANARWNSCERNANALEPHMRTQCSPAPAPAPAPEPTPGKNGTKAPKAHKMADEEFFEELRKLHGIQTVESELIKMKTWLMSPKGSRRTMSRQFVANWFTRIDKPIAHEPIKKDYTF